MRHVSRTHRVALDWLFNQINLDPKIQIKYIDTKNQLADMLTKENFTRDEWNHLVCLFSISHSSSAECSEVMSKRTQEDAGDERVTAKSRPMMSLIARISEKAPSVLASTASESPELTRQESQSPLSRKLKCTIERRNLLFAVTPVTSVTDSLKKHTHQTTRNAVLMKLGLLKSGNLMN